MPRIIIHRHYKHLRFLFCYISLIFLAAVTTASAQSLSVFNIDKSAFPLVKANFYAYDASGSLVEPSQGELTVTEDGIPQTVISVNCPFGQAPKALSSVLVMDVSGSMSSPSGAPNLTLAQQAATAWVNGLPLGNSECAITSFDDQNYFLHDYTKDRAALLAAIAKLTPGGGTDYDKALLLPAAGGLLVTKRAAYQKVLIMLTDGMPIQKPQSSAIIAEAQKQGCMIFAVTLRMPCPQSLKDITGATGGQWFENVTTVQEAKDIYNAIMLQAQGVQPCEIQWQSDESCAIKVRNVAVLWKGIEADIVYASPASASLGLRFSPASMVLRSKPVGIQFDTTVTVTALGKDFTVSDITSLNSGYDINPKSFSLAAGSSKTLTVSYTPADSGYSWTTFSFITNLCQQYFSASGGFPGSGPIQASLKLVLPNGGESFPVRSDTIISWTGISPDDTVKLEYSTDAGTSWITVANKATGGSYPWHIPNTPSGQCLVRVEQLVPDGFMSKDTVITLRGHTNEVTGVTWSPNGQEVATSSKDGNINFWDANTGKLLRTFKGAVANDVAWSPDGSQVAGNSVYDLKLGIATASLFGLVVKEAWSPDGTMIAFGTDKNHVKIVDVSTDATLQDILTTSAPNAIFGNHGVAWSPDGKFVGESTMDATTFCQVWDVKTGKKVRTLNGYSWAMFGSAIAWSPDGSLIATAYTSVIGLWNAATGTLVDTFAAGRSLPQQLEFSPDGTMLLMGGGFNTGTYDEAHIWDVASKKLLKTMHGHTGWMYDAKWSPDGKRVATADADSTAKIWNFTGGPTLPPLQEDISDAVFSIVAPKPASEDIDMGKVLVSYSRDSVIQAFIKNNGTFGFRVDSINISGADASQFFLVSGIPPFDVAAGSDQQVEFLFTPTALGAKSATIHIFAQDTTLIQTIQGTGILPPLSIVNDLIDFDTVFVSTHRDSLQAVTIRNSGATPITITGVRSGGPNSTDFSILTKAGQFTLNPGDTAKLDLRFSPSDIGRTSGTLLFDYAGIGSPATVGLFGEGVLSNAAAYIQAGDAYGYPGDSVNVPILLTKDLNLAQSGATKLTATFRYNASLLYPIGSTPVGTMSGKERIISLDLPVIPITDNILALLPFRVMLGTDTTTLLNLDNPLAIGGVASVLATGGVFHLLGTCPAGGPRLFNPDGQVSMAHINPNPANGIIHIKIQTTETGRTQLKLMNQLGQNVISVFDGELKPGSHSIDLNSHELPSGSYYLMLQTPTLRQMQRVDILK